MEQPCLVSGLNRTSFYVLCVLGSEGSVSSSNCSFSISDKSQNMKVKYSNKSWEDSTEDCVENFMSYSIMDQEMWGAIYGFSKYHWAMCGICLPASLWVSQAWPQNECVAFEELPSASVFVTTLS